jgi:hypothetical protein
VNVLAELKPQISKPAAIQIEEGSQIFALETSQVEDPKDFEQEKKLKDRKSAYVEKDFSDTFRRAISISEIACKINIFIYILMMGFGATLILDSILLSALYSLSLLSITPALLGVVSLVSILLISPQSKITRNAAKNIQYQILYNGYVNQLDILNKPGICEIRKSVSDVERMSNRLEQLTFSTVDKIENLNGTKPSSK